MAALQIHTEGLQIAKALIDRDEGTTRKYRYKECYPLFKSVYDNYYTPIVNVARNSLMKSMC